MAILDCPLHPNVAEAAASLHSETLKLTDGNWLSFHYLKQSM